MSAIGTFRGSHPFCGSVIVRVLLASAIGFGVACTTAEHKGPTVGVLSEGLAQVGSATISVQLVQQLARMRKIPTSQALGLVRTDALFAEYFSASYPQRSEALKRVGLAKQLLTELRRRAIAEGLPSDAEVEELNGARWWEMSRPRMVHVVHAVVMSEEPSEAARTMAGRLLAAVGAHTTAPEFAAAVEGVEKGDWEVKVEALTPVDLQGRTVDPDKPPPVGRAVGQLVDAFAVAAHALTSVGEVSPVVRTQFGYHIMVMHRQWAAHVHSRQQIHDHFAAEIFDNRTRKAQTLLIEGLRRVASPTIDRAALSRMAEWPQD